MPGSPDPTKDIKARRLLAAFDKPIAHAANHPDGENVHEKLKKLYPDPSIPLSDANLAKNFKTTPVPKAWRNVEAFNVAVQEFIQQYMEDDKDDDDTDVNLAELAEHLRAFQEKVGTLTLSEALKKVIEDKSNEIEEELDYPKAWDDNDHAGAKAALDQFTKLYKGKASETEGNSRGWLSWVLPGSKNTTTMPDPPRGKRPGTTPPPPPPPSDDELWPKFAALSIDEKKPIWAATKKEAELCGADWYDVKFRLEFALKNMTSAIDEEEALRLVQQFSRGFPETLNDMRDDFFGDKEMHKAFTEFRKRNPRVTKARDASVITIRDSSDRRSKTPAADRESIPTRAEEGAKIADFDKVWVTDHDDGNERVQGTISYHIKGRTDYLDVKLPPFENPKTGEHYAGERHYLFRCVNHPSEAQNFKEGAPKMILLVSNKDSLKGVKWADIVINHVSCEEPSLIRNAKSGELEVARVLVIGYIRRKGAEEKRQCMTSWSRSVLGQKFGQRRVDNMIKMVRKEAGLPFPRYIRRVPNDSDGSDFESESETEIKSETE
ncbi:hypothetical protein B0H67DRAFT_558330 [Lasiosphaeris hirsuta]|uniref:Uncharacterized protein n=1 Tax=Lasiosphaeris hirsuta TaxID=260670 RepID=A0AA39ZS81_9PEZI|nr:hypothetical protein B0H67DRAFT_558330 [Lasiosphaeris hirsuta]